MQGLRICAILFIAARLVAASLAQPAEAPAPEGPLNITAIFEKAGQFGTFMRLLRSTHVGDQITNQLNNSVNGITIFAPNDNAFSSLPPVPNDKQPVYSDDQLVVYEVDDVLLPIEIFGPPAPAAAPAPVKSKKKGSSIAESPLGADASAAVDLNWGTSGAILSVAGSIFLLWRL